MITRAVRKRRGSNMGRTIFGLFFFRPFLSPPAIAD